MRSRRIVIPCAAFVWALGCPTPLDGSADAGTDSGSQTRDAANAMVDSGPPDSGARSDAGSRRDAGGDAGLEDAGSGYDAAVDAGGGVDASVGDSGVTDAGSRADGGGTGDAGAGGDAGLGDSGATSDGGAVNDAGGSPDACVNTVVTDVLTWHNDLARTGQYLTETCLTAATVNVNQFGLLFILSVDGKVDAQPLYVHGLTIAGATHNVVFVATEHGTLYAFDADTNTGSNAAPLWQVSLMGAGETPSDARGCDQITPEIGVTATPVIEASTQTIYVVAMSLSAGGTYFQRLHAIDLLSGAEAPGSPVTIAATFPGAGPNADGGYLFFDPSQYKERAGLLLLGSTVYLSFASHCDRPPYNGWLMSYDASTLSQLGVWVTTSGGTEGSIWMAGAAPAADSAGNIYVLTGNGTFDTTLNANGFPENADYGNAFLKVSTSGGVLSLSDYFTMSNTLDESANDVDLGSGGVMLLPDTAGSSSHPHLVVGAGKDANLYLVDRDNMGHYDSKANNIVQEIYAALPVQVYSAPAFYDGAIFYGSQGNNLERLPVSNATVALVAASYTQSTFTYPGTFPSISANGPADANAIVWAYENTTPAVVHAYLAADLTNELYSSAVAPGGRDTFGTGNKFIVPTIANGKVYVATTTGVGVFGLR